MTRLLACLVLLLASPVFTSICNLENCFNIRSSDLMNGVQLDDIVNSSNLSTVKFVALTGQAQDNCSISLECTSTYNKDRETKLTIDFIGHHQTVKFTYNPVKEYDDLFETLVNTEVERKLNGELDVGLQFHFKHGVFAYYYTDNLEKIECPYIIAAENEDIITYIKQSVMLLKGEKDFVREEIHRYLKTTNCGEELTISLCPCSEPVITELSWNEETKTLQCTAASIEGSENLNVTLTENNTSVQNVTEKFTKTELTKILTLKNVKSLEISRNITCTVSMLSNNASRATRTITIPARTDDTKHPDGEASKDTDGKNTNSQAFLTILITIIVVSLVVVALVCVGVIKLVQRYKDKRTPEPPTLDAVEPTAGNSEVDEGALIHLYEEDRGSGTQIESNYQDLEELLDAVEPRV